VSFPTIDDALSCLCQVRSVADVNRLKTYFKDSFKRMKGGKIMGSGEIPMEVQKSIGDVTCAISFEIV
jgi:hypothetical protein